MKVLLVVALLLVAAGITFAQSDGSDSPPPTEPGGSETNAGESGPSSSGSDPDSDTTLGDEPAPYERNEFPEWAWGFRRAEIVGFGSYPITLLASRLVYGLGRFVYKSIQAGAIDPSYAPWFFAPPGAPPLESVEKLGIVLGAAALSIGISIADAILGRADE